MLEVVYYQSSGELLSTVSEVIHPLVIAPSPAVADNLRILLPETEILTISKWVSNYLSETQKTRTRKSEIMLKLAAIWKHYFPDGSAAKFNEVFELFTELRSFTLQLELLSEFFRELDEESVKSILLFWTYLDQEKIIDEQLAYFQASELVQNKHLLFIGFKHLNGVQIDMLKRLGENQDVSLFFPQQLLSEILPNDWIKWLDPGETKASKNGDDLPNLKVFAFPQGKANQILKDISEETDLVLATTKASVLNIQEFHRAGQFFKTQEDIFSSERDSLKDFLQKIVVEKKKTDECLNILEDYKIQSLKLGNYKLSKIIMLAVDALQTFSGFSDQVDAFVVEIVMEIVRLNSPRTSLVSVEKNIKSSILDLSGLSFRQLKGPAVFASSQLGSFKGTDKILSEAMSKALKAIGPIKRAGLEFQFHKLELINSLNQPSSILFIEEDLLESDLSWKEIFKFFTVEIEALKLESEINNRGEKLYQKMRKGPFSFNHLSASALQYYIDCPRKFYFNQIQKINPRPEFKNQIAADEMGNLEHNAISLYFAKAGIQPTVEVELCRAICNELINALCTEKSLELTSAERAKAFNELLAFTLNGIIFITEFACTYSASGIKFEFPLPSNTLSLKGFIDCIVELPDNKIAIFDFKRSASAAGTKNETLTFQKIQIWTYLTTAIEAGLEIHSFGYVNLADMEDDKLIFIGPDANKVLSDNLLKARERIISLSESIKNEISFPANPRDTKVCTFCSVSLFCDRGIV